MLENFVSMDYILTFTGMVVMVSLLTQFTKRLFDKIGYNRTKWVVYGYSGILCVIAAIWQGNFSTSREIIETAVVWSINSIVVWFTAMKTFETVSSKEDI